jgi:hypothetical protein
MDPYLEGRRIWPDVHASLIVAIRDYLIPLLEPAYYVGVEERVFITRADRSERTIVPDVPIIAGPEPHLEGIGPAGGLAVATIVATEAQTVTVPLYETGRERYLEIRDAEGNELITSIELLSPSNKVPGARRREYEAKRRQVFEARTSLVEIDLLRAGRPMEMQPLPPPTTGSWCYRAGNTRAPNCSLSTSHSRSLTCRCRCEKAKRRSRCRWAGC